jgi:hypothetical protein
MALYNEAKNILVGASPLYITNSDSTVDGYATNVANSEPGVARVAVTGKKNAVPAYSSSASYRTTLDGVQGTTDNSYRNVGYTSNGLQITYNPTYDSVTVDQLLDTAKLFKSAMEVMIMTEMAEGTLENILVVFGQGQSTLVSSTLGLEAGALGVQPTERQLIAIGQAPTTTSSNSERIYYARRVLSVQQSQFSLARNTPTTFPVTFRLLPDSAYAGSEYGKIIDRTWTPA